MRPRDPCAQAAVELVSLLLVIGAALALSAAAVPGVGERVVATVRTGVCIVGGDVCRDADAAAAGLEPCVTSARSRRQDTTVDIAVIRLGGHGEWQLALRSDGGAVVTRLEQNELGGTLGAGLMFSPAGVGAAATAGLVAEYRGGRAWRFADAGSARTFLDAAMHDSTVQAARAPDLRWQAIGGHATVHAGLTAAELARSGLDAGAAGAIGLGSDGDLRTLTLDLKFADPHLTAELPGVPAAPGTQRSWVANVSWERDAPRELALRTATAGHGRLEEYSARLDLRDPANRAVARRLLRPDASTPLDLVALAARIRTDGVIERLGYRIRERRRGISIGGKLGIGLGLEHFRVTAERRLVDATAWVRGGPPQRRFDCLGV
jgi:hypothetical protein